MVARERNSDQTGLPGLVGLPPVAGDVRERVDRLGAGGGDALCSSHHIQADTPIENVLAMYQTEWRYRS